MARELVSALCASRRVRYDVVSADIFGYCGSASIPPSCFAPPICTARIPRAWDRVAVPRAGASRRSDYKIYKRVTVGLRVDERYQAAVTELESQGFGERKRTKTNVYVRPYGIALSGRREDTVIVGTELLDNARGRLRKRYLSWLSRVHTVVLILQQIKYSTLCSLYGRRISGCAAVARFGASDIPTTQHGSLGFLESDTIHDGLSTRPARSASSLQSYSHLSSLSCIQIRSRPKSSQCRSNKPNSKSQQHVCRRQKSPASKGRRTADAIAIVRCGHPWGPFPRATMSLPHSPFLLLVRRPGLYPARL